MIEHYCLYPDKFYSMSMSAERTENNIDDSITPICKAAPSLNAAYIEFPFCLLFSGILIQMSIQCARKPPVWSLLAAPNDILGTRFLAELVSPNDTETKRTESSQRDRNYPWLSSPTFQQWYCCSLRQAFSSCSGKNVLIIIYSLDDRNAINPSQCFFSTETELPTPQKFSAVLPSSTANQNSFGFTRDVVKAFSQGNYDPQKGRFDTQGKRRKCCQQQKGIFCVTCWCVSLA